MRAAAGAALARIFLQCDLFSKIANQMTDWYGIRKNRRETDQLI
ncbi:hypothetical protein C7S15_7830 [Burkholderia cepacia]|nr:hypothetical protein [Burkholderia cepacia]